MIGIGVGIDYALLIVTRLPAGPRTRASSRRRRSSLAVDTSGRAVLFAGMHRRHLAARHVPDQPGLHAQHGHRRRRRGAHDHARPRSPCCRRCSASSATTSTASALPHRELPTTTTCPSHAFWYRWSRVIQKHPWPAADRSAALLIALRLPASSLLRLGFADAGNRPDDATRHAAPTTCSAEGFGPGFNGPLFARRGRPGRPARRRDLTDAQAAIEPTPRRRVSDPTCHELGDGNPVMSTSSRRPRRRTRRPPTLYTACATTRSRPSSPAPTSRY